MSFEMDGVLIGHAHNEAALTGVSVLIFPQGAVGGIEVRGGAPASRETELLRPLKLVEQLNAVVVAGGSAFGLAAADGVMSFLEEKGWGYDTGVAIVPIVPAAALFDLSVGDASVRPDAAMGYAACQASGPDLSPQGNVGAGMGATVGKALGDAWAMKAGWGFAAFSGAQGLVVASFVAVNAFGDVVSEEGKIVAGARDPQGGFLDTERFLERSLGGEMPGTLHTNTTVGVIVTNARLSKSEANWVAQGGHHGFARSIRPSHTRLDGDTVFAVSVGSIDVAADLVGVIGARTMAQAVRNAVLTAAETAGIPAAADSG
jgi:L-aminopeptidase/D-esterase-like protein